MRTINIICLTLVLGISGLYGQSVAGKAGVPLRSDSIMSSDKFQRLHVSIHYWSVKGEAGNEQRLMLNEKIQTWLCEYIRELPFPDPDDSLQAVQNEFDIEPVQSHIDNRINSILYVVTVQYAGAVHPMSYYYSMNYDFINRKEVMFSDYFHLKSAGDSTKMNKLINRGLQPANTFPEVFSLENNNLIPAIFNLEGDSISFDYGDYALGQGPSMIKVEVARSALLPFINPEYQ